MVACSTFCTAEQSQCIKLLITDSILQVKLFFLYIEPTVVVRSTVFVHRWADQSQCVKLLITNFILNFKVTFPINGVKQWLFVPPFAQLSRASVSNY